MLSIQHSKKTKKVITYLGRIEVVKQSNIHNIILGKELYKL